MHPKKIEIAPYSSHWPRIFEEEAMLVKQALGCNCIDIHPIGSTSVSGLAAKPIIDMMPVVQDITQVDEASTKMQSLGYQAKGENGIPFRRYFQKSMFHAHIFEQGNPEIDRHLRFRNWMRLHEDDRKLYEALKRHLAAEFPNDITAYCCGKESFIADIDTKAGFIGLRIAMVLTDREWEAYHRILEKNLEASVRRKSYQNVLESEAKNRYHFVLYKGTVLVAAAHVELGNAVEVAIKALAVDEPYKGFGYDAHLIKVLEKWAKQRGGNTKML